MSAPILSAFHSSDLDRVRRIYSDIAKADRDTPPFWRWRARRRHYNRRAELFDLLGRAIACAKDSDPNQT